MWTLDLPGCTLRIVAVRVGVREFRENLKDWLDRAADGEELIVTERGAAKVKVSAPGAESVLERLIREGKATAPSRERRHLDPVRERDASPVTDALLEQRRAKDY